MLHLRILVEPLRQYSKDCYHRTVREINGKDVATQFTAGTHLGWSSVLFVWDCVGRLFCFSKELTPTTYRHYAPSGTNFWTGADYGYQHPRWPLVGETGTDKGSIARWITLPICLLLQASSLLFAVQRYYGYQYTAPLRHVVCRGAVQNESGSFIGELECKTGFIVHGFILISLISHLRFGAHTASKAWITHWCLPHIRQRWSLWLAIIAFRIREKDNEIWVNEVTQRGRLFFDLLAESWASKASWCRCKQLSRS